MVSTVDGVRNLRNSNGRRVLVTDLDNTLIDSRERFKRSMAEALGHPSIASAPSVLVVKKLSKEQRDRFYDSFLSGKYMNLDIPVKGGVEVLSRLRASGLGIIYLTGRPHTRSGSMKTETLKTLSRFGFPTPNGREVVLFMKSKRSSPTNEFKRAVLVQLSKKRDLAIGLDDEMDDLRVMIELVPLVIGVALSSDIAREISARLKIPIARDWFQVESIISRSGLIPKTA